MNEESEKYKRILNILRESKPVLNSAEEIEKEVLRTISEHKRSTFILSDAVEFLFSWIYIRWVRRILITASVCLVAVFILQQGIILKQINYLSRQTIPNSMEGTFDPAEIIEKQLQTYKLSGRRFRSPAITISEEQMNQLLDSVNKLQIKYKDLMNMIEEDPELKKIVEKKLLENNRTKIKL